jgi:hypothetical protein
MRPKQINAAASTRLTSKPTLEPKNVSKAFILAPLAALVTTAAFGPVDHGPNPQCYQIDRLEGGTITAKTQSD